jgi:hypothetical protein
VEFGALAGRLSSVRPSGALVESAEMNRQIADYLYFGDQREVRPFIRASENLLKTSNKGETD